MLERVREDHSHRRRAMSPTHPNETVNQFDGVSDKPSRHVDLYTCLGHTGFDARLISTKRGEVLDEPEFELDWPR
jgi:hypothetical protein